MTADPILANEWLNTPIGEVSRFSTYLGRAWKMSFPTHVSNQHIDIVLQAYKAIGLDCDYEYIGYDAEGMEYFIFYFGHDYPSNLVDEAKKTYVNT